MSTVVSKLTQILRTIIRSGQWSYPETDWQRKFEDYDRYRYYVSGEVFKELADPGDSESPLRYPLKVNVLEDVADIETGYFWGEHGDDDMVQFLVPPLKHGREQASDLAQQTAGKLQERLTSIWRNNRINSMLDQAYWDSFVDGGVYFRQYYDPIYQTVRIQPLLAQYVFPRWHPMDLNKMLEVVVSFEMYKADAKDVFGVEGSGWGNTCLYWERWTPWTYEQTIDDTVIHNGVNPYGFIPIVYIPRLRTGTDFYGRSGAGPLLGIQNQINDRLADIGDGINYNSHPIRWLKNYSGNVKDLPLGADAVWNLGTTSEMMGEPEVGVLESKSDYAGSMNYVQALVDISQDIAHVPPIARGRDEGSQRSGITLVVRMLPLIKLIGRVRLWWKDGLAEISRNALVIDDMFNRPPQSALVSEPAPMFPTMSKAIEAHAICPQFWPVLPKDEQALIDQNIDLVNAGLKHPIDAMRDLGDTDPEKSFEAIQQYLKEKQATQPQVQHTSTRRVVKES